MNRLPDYLAPVEEPVLERGDDLDWSSLPKEPADLNFQLEVTNTAATQWHLMVTAVVTSFLSLPSGMLFRWFGPLTLSTVCFAIAFLLACCKGLARARQHGADEQQTLRALFFSFAFPLQLWAMIALAHFTYSIGWALAYLVILALPLVFQLIDQFSTHAVHWFTALPTVSLPRLNQWRKSWAARFDPAPANNRDNFDVDAPNRLDVIRLYWEGWKRIAGCFALGFVVVVFLSARGMPLYRVGLWFFVTVSTAMMAVCVLSRRRLSFARWWLILLAWYGHDTGRRSPNWVLQSPTGDALQRQHALTAAVWFLALGCCFVTDHYSWFLTCDPAMYDLVQYGTTSTGAPDLDFTYLQRGGALAAFYFIVTIIICILAPCLLLLLIAFVATSPLFFHLQQHLTTPRNT